MEVYQDGIYEVYYDYWEDYPIEVKRLNSRLVEVKDSRVVFADIKISCVEFFRFNLVLDFISY